MKLMVLVIGLLVGCSGKKKEAEAQLDDCTRFVEKMMPSLGQPVSSEDRTRFIFECRSKVSALRPDPTMQCVLDAKDADGIKLCMTIDREARDAGTPEPVLALNRIGKNLKTDFQTMSEFPKGKSKTLPATPCCKGPGKMCPVTKDWAADPLWSEIEFSVDEPNHFQYSYESDGTKATVKAVGDADCDGTIVTYRLDVTPIEAAKGAYAGAQAVLTSPANAD